MIDSIGEDECGSYVQIGNILLRAKTIFDSRTPNYKETDARVPHIFQSFVGWMIETESSVFKADTFRFMDFNISQ